MHGLQYKLLLLDLVDWWFRDQLPPQRLQEDVDKWTVKSRNAYLGKAGTWWMHTPSYVVELISVSLWGAESTSNQRLITCVFRMNKCLVVKILPTRLQRIRGLINVLTKVGEHLGPTKEEKEGENQGVEILLTDSPVPLQHHRTMSVSKQDDGNKSTLNPWDWLHVSFALQIPEDRGTNKP